MIKNLLSQVLDDDQILENEPMKNHTSFKIGGNARFLVQPNSIEVLAELVKILKDVPQIVMGNGSNLLIGDNGFDGVVIKICGALSRTYAEDNIIIAESGALLSRIANVALENGLSGFEFAAGIPGTLGGAVVMNAGAYGGEMKDVIISTEYIDENGDIKEITEHEFDYRKSIFSDKKWIITKCRIQLCPNDKIQIKALMADLAERRREKQPLEFPSAGSTFKRPDGFYAGRLIEDAGLKGYTIGGAQISEKHGGFIINTGNATFDDVARLIEYVKQKVYEQFGVELETEVKIIDEH